MKTSYLVLAGFLVSILGFAFYMGAFHQVVITEEPRGPYTHVYRDLPDVSQELVGVLTSEIDQLLEELGITERTVLDVYHADGSAQVGFAVIVDSMSMSLSDGTRVKTIPRQQMLVAEFPWRNEMSYIIGYLKVDPMLAAHRDAGGYARTEIMTMQETGAITYLQPVRPAKP
jgi:hypothetical protein